jgi:hypothetical protein
MNEFFLATRVPLGKFSGFARIARNLKLSKITNGKSLLNFFQSGKNPKAIIQNVLKYNLPFVSEKGW